MLKQIATDLEKRAKNDIVGGWSTNHVEPMRKLADKIFAHLGRGGSDTEPTLLQEVGEKLDQFDREVVMGGWSTQNRDFFKKQSDMIFSTIGRCSY